MPVAHPFHVLLASLHRGELLLHNEGVLGGTAVPDWPASAAVQSAPPSCGGAICKSNGCSPLRYMMGHTLRAFIHACFVPRSMGTAVKWAMRIACRFPGPPASYNYAVDMTDVDLLVEAEEWLATNVTPATANTAFNITNGDVTRWKHVRWDIVGSEDRHGWTWLQSSSFIFWGQGLCGACVESRTHDCGVVRSHCRVLMRRAGLHQILGSSGVGY